MNRLFWKAIKIAPVLFAGSLFAATGASAQSISADKGAVNNTLQQINNYQQLDQGDLSQVTNVNQLRDVSPTDWAYEALRSLVDRYGCISGFPNQTYRGSQPLTRYEFAAGLNSCLNQIERLIASTEAVSQEDLDTIARLSQEFEAELATIGGRVDELESRTAVLEDSQFSTTTKLNGETIFAISDAFGGGLNAENLAEENFIAEFGGILDLEDEDDIEDTDISDSGIGDFDGNGDLNSEDITLDFVGDFNEDGEINEDDIEDFEDDTEIDAQTAFSSRVRLNFDSSFFGQDRLRARLEAGNITDYGTDVTGTDSARFGFDTNTATDESDYNVEVTDLHYRFPFNERINVWVGPFGLDIDDIFAVNNPSLEDSATGALSRFSRRDPVLLRGTEGAGAGVNLDIIPDRVGINVLYLTDDANSTEEGEGLFNGSFSAGAQVEVSPIESLDLTAGYIRNFQTADSVNQSGSTVTGEATVPFTLGGAAIDTIANKIGIGANLSVAERITVGAWGSYAFVSGIVEGDDNNPEGEIWTAGGNISVLDLIKEGSQLSLAGGIVPKFSADLDSDESQAAIDAGVELDEDDDTSFLLEALYKFPLNDNILITPGVYAIFNPNHETDNDTVVVGALRTTFKF